MKPALKVDLDLARHLYLNGLKPHVIAQQLLINVHSLKKHAQRHEWTALKAKVSEHVSLNEPMNKHNAARRWVDAVNNLGEFGRWDFIVCREMATLPNALTARATQPLNV